ncbi:hemolysin XhlA [Providencia rettgeri]
MDNASNLLTSGMDNNHWKHKEEKTTGGNGGGGYMEPRVAKLESDVEYIKRDIGEIKENIREIQKDQKSLDRRIGDVEQEIRTFKTVVKATGAVVSVIFVACAAVFGTYLSKILDAINGLVLQ